ncbi:MAG: diacylglycerol kinase family protein [Lachnospiraceae bacterium]|nr:diacylglycerol kinase family protein [Lachnospiraceae bacterium]
MKYHVLYNPVCYYGKGAEEAQKINEHLASDDLTFYDMTKINDYPALLSGFAEDSGVIICGGDGTLNRFINDKGDYEIKQQVYYYAIGSGTDFMTDIGGKRMDPPVNITKYLRDLPVATVDGKDYFFLNNVGFGLDGYCSGEAERMLSKGATEINFAKIAIGGLFGRFKPSCATISVSGNTRTFKRVYIATTMHGRYYGGGMLPTPNQDRLNRNHNVSTILMYGCGPLSVLFTFPAFFKGTHLKKARICKVYSGYDVNVIFDKPCEIQIDGEYLGKVSEYHVRTSKRQQEED